ncbi:hypothetical protein WME94_20155 [Sorangium sp. So ce429]
MAWGVTPILRYDPLGRLIQTDLPNGTSSRVVFDAWKQTSHDPNDTVLKSAWYAARQALPTGDPERRAADLAAAHAGTPAVSSGWAGSCSIRRATTAASANSQTAVRARAEDLDTSFDSFLEE